MAENIEISEKERQAQLSAFYSKLNSDWFSSDKHKLKSSHGWLKSYKEQAMDHARGGNIGAQIFLRERGIDYKL